MNNTLNTTAALSLARLRTFLTFAAITFGMASCGKQGPCTETYQVVTQVLDQPVTGHADGTPFESAEEAQLYANFLSHTDSTTFVQTVINCD